MGAFEDFLAETGVERCRLLELDTLTLAALSDGTIATTGYAEHAYSEVAYGEGDGNETGGLATLYFSSHGFTSKAADTPASKFYPGRIKRDIYVERRIIGRSGIAGLAKVAGRVVLSNADGGLDTLLSTYAIDGRAARLLLGRPTDARSAFGQILTGIVAATPGLSARALTLDISDGLARLDVPINTYVYAGTGALEGGADLKGKPRPKCWGNALNVPAVLVDAVKRIYEVNHGAISDVPAVYDRGIALAKGADYASQSELETTAPAAAQYRVWKGGGFFRLGSEPSGTVTADVLGDADGGYINKTADIVQRLLKNQAAFDSLEIDAASFAQLNIDAPAEVGIWCGPEAGHTVRAAVDELLAGVGAFGGFNRTAKFTVGLVAVAAGAPVATFTELHILDIVREPLPDEIDPVVYRARVSYQRNYTVQSDLASAVSSARRAFAAEAVRIAVRENLAAKSQRPLARELGPTGLYAQSADADTEALRRINLWSPARAVYRIRLRELALVRDLGEVVRIKFPRFGFSGGVDVRILGHKINGRLIELLVLA